MDAESKEIHKIISPTDKTIMYYDVRNRDIVSVEYSRKTESGGDNSESDDQAENPDREDRTQRSGAGEVEATPEEKETETDRENSSSEQEAENVFLRGQKTNFRLDNW